MARKIKINTVKYDLVSTLDITKTIMDIIGVKPVRPALHGRNLFDGSTSKREFIFSARDKMDSTYDASRAIRSKKFKLIQNLMPERPYCQLNKYKENSYPTLAEMNVLYLKGKLNKDEVKFMATEKPELELYDIINDPYELNNLADNPEYNNVKKEYLKKLNQWRLFVKDQGVTDEFRKGGWPATYPTRSLEDWEKHLEDFKPWVFRKPDSKVEHPYSKW